MPLESLQYPPQMLLRSIAEPIQSKGNRRVEGPAANLTDKHTVKTDQRRENQRKRDPRRTANQGQTQHHVYSSQATQIGVIEMLNQLDELIKKAEKRQDQPLATTLRADREVIANCRSLPALDRYLTLICPEGATAVDYLPPDAAVFLCESGRVDERVKGAQLQLRQDIESLMESGLMTGEFARIALSPEELYTALEDFPVIMMDSLPTSFLAPGFY